MAPIVVEQTLRRFTIKEKQTSNILFNQNHRRGYHMGNKGQNQKGKGGYRSMKVEDLIRIFKRLPEVRTLRRILMGKIREEE